MIKALIFDFDGLILDTETPLFYAWQEIFHDYGCSLPLPIWARSIGTTPEAFDPYEYLEAQIGRSVDRESLHSRSQQRWAELLQAQSVLPGVKDYLAHAKKYGLKLGAASTSSRAWVTGHLARLGLLADFDSIKCSEDVKHVKPDPELYLAVLDTLHLRAEEAVALEDSPNGIAAAKAAGLVCVAVPNPLTQGLPLHRADFRLTSLADLPLERLLTKVNERLRNGLAPLADHPDPPCDICSGPTYEAHCKIICRNCGYTRDCSDP